MIALVLYVLATSTSLEAITREARSILLVLVIVTIIEFKFIDTTYYVLVLDLDTTTYNITMYT